MVSQAGKDLFYFILYTEVEVRFMGGVRLDSLPVKELSSSNCHGPVSGVDQVVHVLAVLIGQRVLAAPVAGRHNGLQND